MYLPQENNLIELDKKLLDRALIHRPQERERHMQKRKQGPVQNRKNRYVLMIYFKPFMPALPLMTKQLCIDFSRGTSFTDFCHLLGEHCAQTFHARNVCTKPTLSCVLIQHIGNHPIRRAQKQYITGVIWHTRVSDLSQPGAIHHCTMCAHQGDQQILPQTVSDRKKRKKRLDMSFVIE